MKKVLPALILLSSTGSLGFSAISNIRNIEQQNERLNEVSSHEDPNCGISDDRTSITFCAKKANYYKRKDKGVYIRSNENIGETYTSEDSKKGIAKGLSATMLLNDSHSITLSCPEGYEIPPRLGKDFGQSDTEGESQVYLSDDPEPNGNKEFLKFTVSTKNYHRTLEPVEYFIPPSLYNQYEFEHYKKVDHGREMMISCVKSTV